MSVDESVPNGSQITREQSAISPRTDKTSRKSVSKKAVKAAIVSYLRNNPKATYQEIGDNFEMKRTTVFNYLNELAETGLIKT